MDKVSIKARKKARKIAMQALYQWAMTGMDLYQIQAQFHYDNDMARIDAAYFDELLYQIPKNLTEVDAAFAAYLDRAIQELNPVELAIIRLGTYELMKRPDIPYKVVINEAVTLTKEYGATEGHKYVNGVLDKVAQQLRATEIHLTAS